ncbi:MAG: hypothetical protein JXR46_04065 [Calditrichaceae bacterium]|nr:hypothetical protein [Calditrichaceae bacterium]MBN2708202.1 hypothetical protein [Calditrichaceae bacterium]RQV97394.1 MAG: hypothetical protein EH224_01595 [Calditrichota bacterium]
MIKKFIADISTIIKQVEGSNFNKGYQKYPHWCYIVFFFVGLVIVFLLFRYFPVIIFIIWFLIPILTFIFSFFVLKKKIKDLTKFLTLWISILISISVHYSKNEIRDYVGYKFIDGYSVYYTTEIVSNTKYDDEHEIEVPHVSTDNILGKILIFIFHHLIFPIAFLIPYLTWKANERIKFINNN